MFAIQTSLNDKRWYLPPEGRTQVSCIPGKLNTIIEDGRSLCSKFFSGSASHCVHESQPFYTLWELGLENQMQMLTPWMPQLPCLSQDPRVFCQHPQNWRVNLSAAGRVKSQTLQSSCQSRCPYHQLSHKANFPNLFLHLNCKPNRKYIYFCSVNLLIPYYTTRSSRSTYSFSRMLSLPHLSLRMSTIQSEHLLPVLEVFIVRKDKRHPDYFRWWGLI